MPGRLKICSTMIEPASSPGSRLADTVISGISPLRNA